jgi:hypothetical protein
LQRDASNDSKCAVSEAGAMKNMSRFWGCGGAMHLTIRGVAAALLALAILVCVPLFGAGCPLLNCPNTEETLPLPEAGASGDAGGAPQADGGGDGAVGDGGLQDAAARCRASANDCLAYCRAIQPTAQRCERVTVDGGGYGVHIVYELPCL